MEISPGWHMCAICNLWFPLWISSYIQELLIVWLRSGEGGWRLVYAAVKHRIFIIASIIVVSLQQMSSISVPLFYSRLPLT